MAGAGEKLRGGGKGEEQGVVANEGDKSTVLAPLTSSHPPLKALSSGASGLSLLPKLNLGGEGGGGGGGGGGEGEDPNPPGMSGGEGESSEEGEGTSVGLPRVDKGHGPAPPPLKLDFSALSPSPQGVQPPASPSKGPMSAKGLGPGPGITARTLLPTARAPSKNTALALARKRRPLVLFPEENDR